MPDIEISVQVDAPPDVVWSLVADVERMGEWSPICRRCEWIGEPAAPVEGARFKGFNNRRGFRWTRDCVVTEAEPGRVFAFTTYYGPRESTRWRYSFEQVPDGGTLVTESYEAVYAPWYVRVSWLVPGIRSASARDQLAGMRTTLERVRSAAEARRPTSG